jgi:hypothetical protein
MRLGFVNKREGLSTLSLSNAALLVRVFLPKQGFFVDFLYISPYRDVLGGRGVRSASFRMLMSLKKRRMRNAMA